jgi:DNA-binding Lrp family transcriptional regulator
MDTANDTKVDTTWLETTLVQGDTMVTAIVLMQVERKEINQVAEVLAETSGITEVYSVSGKYDLVAIVRVKNNDDLADLVTRKILQIEAISKTETMLAFKAYSKHDLEAMFNLGM